MCLFSLSCHGRFKVRPTVFAYIFPMRRARRCAGQDTEYGGHERPETMRLFQYELDVGRMAAGAVFSLFRYHLVAFEQGHGTFIVVFIHENIHSGNRGSESAQDVGRVFVVQDGGDAFVFQRPLNQTGLKGSVTGDKSDCFHKTVELFDKISDVF